MILLSLITTILILSLSVILIKMNFTSSIAIGIGWTVGHGIASVVYLFLMRRLIFNRLLNFKKN